MDIENELKKIKKEVAAAALRTGSIAFNFSSPWKWASGYYMPIYNDNRLLLSEYANRSLVFKGLELIVKQNFLKNSLRSENSIDVIAGCATGGIAPALGLADLLEKEFIYVRSSSKSHGKSQAVEGKSPAGKNVLVVEDLISTGGSSIAVIDKINEIKGNTIGCLSIFSYGFEKSKENFRKIDLEPISLITFDTLLKTGEELSLLSSEEVEKINSWLASPFEWGKNNGFS